MQLRKLLFILVLLFPFTRAFAATFVVTSNADSGPGTLRDAISQAIAAGNTVAKTITFNLPDTSVTGRTITLVTQLSGLPSNLTIDASTQPGLSFGVSDAKVKLLLNTGDLIPDTALKIVSQSNVTILGLYLYNEYTNHVNANPQVFGMYISKSANIQVGAAGKGNVIFGFGYSIKADTLNSYFTMQDNFCDVDADGQTIAVNLVQYFGILLHNVNYSINIGGATAAEGNLVEGLFTLDVIHTAPFTAINIQYNKLGTDYYTTKSLNGGLILDLDSDLGDNNAGVNVNDNVLSGYFNIYGFGQAMTFLRNYINVDRTETHDLAPYSTVAGFRIIQTTGPVVIGSTTNTADGNVIAYCQPFDFEQTNKVSFNRNSMFCTTNLSSIYTGSAYSPIPTVYAVIKSGSGVRGSATANSLVELFYSDRCQTCSPETYLATVQANAGGGWAYNGPVNGHIIASATLNGSTSLFFNDIGFITTNLKITPPACYGGNGSITGIQVLDATQFQWTNVTTNKVAGTTPDLLNVPAGTYMLTVTNTGGCSKSLQAYVIPQPPPPQYPAYSYTLKNSCPDQPTGSIVITTDTLVTGYRWVNSAGDSIANKAEINKLVMGTYSLYLTDQRGCSTFYKSYTIYNIVPLGIDTVNVQITGDECNLKTGSISGIEAKNGILPYTYTWGDASGTTVSTNPSLNNVGAGTYTLTVTDSSGCGPATITYTIPSTEITILTPAVSNEQVCSSGNILITVNNASATGIYNLYTSESSTTPADQSIGGKFKVTVTRNTSFFITQINGTCESSKAEADVTIGLSALNIANTFTPNGDGINDYWKINNIENYPQAIVQVFTRYGEKIFESKGYAVPFDGTYKGQKLPAGVYYFIINLNSNCSLLSGSLTIIR